MSEKCMEDFHISLEWADQQPTPKRKHKLGVGQSDDLQVRMHKDVHMVTMVTTILQPLRVKGTASTSSFIISSPPSFVIGRSGLHSLNNQHRYRLY